MLLYYQRKSFGQYSRQRKKLVPDSTGHFRKKKKKKERLETKMFWNNNELSIYFQLKQVNVNLNFLSQMRAITLCEWTLRWKLAKVLLQVFNIINEL